VDGATAASSRRPVRWPAAASRRPAARSTKVTSSTRVHRARTYSRPTARATGRIHQMAPARPGPLHRSAGNIYGAIQGRRLRGPRHADYAKARPTARAEVRGKCTSGGWSTMPTAARARRRHACETALFNQRRLLDEALDSIQPAVGRDRHGTSSPSAATARSSVPPRGQYVRGDFDARFGTKGRSIALVTAAAPRRARRWPPCSRSPPH